MKPKKKAWTGSVNVLPPHEGGWLLRKGAFISSRSLRSETSIPLSEKKERRLQLINTPIEHSAKEASYSPGQSPFERSLPDGELMTEDIAIFVREMCHREDSSGYLVQSL